MNYCDVRKQIMSEMPLDSFIGVSKTLPAPLLAAADTYSKLERVPERATQMGTRNKANVAH